MDILPLTVYADLNCPFCYTLHERLLALGCLDQVEWRLIEHAPQIKYDVNDLHMYREMTEEVSRVRKKAPEVAIVIPRGRPNTHTASLLVNELQRTNPGLARELRTEFYRSLWQNDLDYSDDFTLSELLYELDLSMPTISHEAQERLRKNQDEWETGDFSQSIPALINHEGNRILGLPNRDVLRAILFGYRELSDEQFHGQSVCVQREKPRVLVAADTHAHRQELAACFRGEYELEFADSSRQVLKVCTGALSVDLVVMSPETREFDSFTICKLIKERELSHNIPVMIMAREREPTEELRAFEMGASEYLSLSSGDDVIRARANNLLKHKRTSDLLAYAARLDVLTEISNRFEYERSIEQLWTRSVRGSHPATVLLLDIDSFEAYYDHYGHAKGEECIKTIAHFLRDEFQSHVKTIARVGDKRFAMILEGKPSEFGLNLASQIQSKLCEMAIPHEYSGEKKKITFSIAVASVIPSRSNRPGVLLGAAESAMQKAKEQGGDQIILGEAESSSQNEIRSELETGAA